ncbi:hypothetical protein CPB83DRAFT_759588 [Crepidotus variabilis]|uniref:Zn(2)-C6 fungal-type domain-containing protein n=1 Tax=Crepidotus variabilis TaxID=179855 RepID=A0A9P6EM47_9AGAR|nr:hypothetical protein CPB83DRAFT_759588 [Crepidotus variabilis]
MPPRGSSAATSPPKNANTPYSRRPSSQPKSSRQQFSACGACRMRRVRCDLKDLPIASAGPNPACSNCKERGINCIDEFADVKAVKLLRRGRRLQQVEAIYGKMDEQDDGSSSSGSKQQSSIPTLHADFFTSPFWRWFVIHRPILDPVEFPTRFAAHFKGSDQLGSEGGVVAMLLVTWAASFGLDERGVPLSSKPDQSAHPYAPPRTQRSQWKVKTEGFIREILELVDYHGILRRPTMDGLRALLLLLPLLDDAQPLERVAIYDAALSQAHTICVLSAPHPPTYEEAAVRARVFWYIYTQESMSTGMRGNRFVLCEDDLDAFQATLPPPNFDVESSGLHTPPSPSRYVSLLPFLTAREYTAHKDYMQVLRNSSIPLELAKICRRIHTVLTGPRATRRAEDHGLVDANGMREIWRDLDRCWQELLALKQLPVELEGSARRLELNQYVDSWRIFIFECHNVIREGLKHFASSPGSQSGYVDPSTSRPSSAAPYLSPQHLHGVATRRCIALLPAVIRILRSHSPRDHSDLPGVFRWDAGLVKDGCFFAGYLAASIDRDVLDTPGEEDKRSDGPLSVDEAVSICLDALAVMRWAYSKSEEREETVRLIWENRKLRHQGQGSMRSGALYDSAYGSGYNSPSLSLGLSGSGSTMLPPLLSVPHRRIDSAPSTASSTDGRGMNGWPSYSPPGTGTSMATSNGTALSSGSNSPIFANMPPFKGNSEEIFYHAANGNEMEHFTYSVPLGGSTVDRDGTTIPASLARYRHSPPHVTAGSPAVSYPFHTSTPPILADFQSCPQFGDDCNGSYH